jgi:hypothetical protein
MFVGDEGIGTYALDLVLIIDQSHFVTFCPWAKVNSQSAAGAEVDIFVHNEDLSEVDLEYSLITMIFSKKVRSHRVNRQGK